ncbi:hypothetical protein CkaCkLH20_07740 [Colletotrichum karsti]|uniref:Uncharacterized protein n=1 Tax=Colletotrichum karsti TaxID=1095194 RepID=A0A9P6LIH5_9PEZI|nr:uncharacterized protein CkaCkLH20_07740 [Colletotrichum karsti]KAF9874603.1 hypothetical protein CkaCkLH20_07740 [Colletotrichum karsti]
MKRPNSSSVGHPESTIHSSGVHCPPAGLSATSPSEAPAAPAGPAGPGPGGKTWRREVRVNIVTDLISAYSLPSLPLLLYIRSSHKQTHSFLASCTSPNLCPELPPYPTMASHEQDDTMPEETQGYKLSQPKQSLAEYQKMGEY